MASNKSKSRKPPSAPATPRAPESDSLALERADGADALTTATATPSPASIPDPTTGERLTLRAETFRRRSLGNAGFEADCCALLGRPLDIGPRASLFDLPVHLDDDVISEIGVTMLAAGVTPEQLEHAAAWLRAREG